MTPCLLDCLSQILSSHLWCLVLIGLGGRPLGMPAGVILIPLIEVKRPSTCVWYIPRTGFWTSLVERQNWATWTPCSFLTGCSVTQLQLPWLPYHNRLYLELWAKKKKKKTFLPQQLPQTCFLWNILSQQQGRKLRTKMSKRKGKQKVRSVLPAKLLSSCCPHSSSSFAFLSFLPFPSSSFSL